MSYILICYDAPDSLEVRKETRAKHIKYIENHLIKVTFAGPILDEKENPIGSIIVLDCNKIEDAKKFSINDPYYLKNVFKKVQIHKFKKVF
ncbi:MAG: hypothetical protein CMN00_03890 [Rickettsiales bacterium]|nr:hypothetical protein [Rickettsiales bacterium]|tara:strand:+ start:97 stop:369 length:273 start_codon:yes stop_codon:yes gene_type:complete